MKHSAKYRKNREGYYSRNAELTLKQLNRLRAEVGLPNLEPKVRHCLKCDKEFHSQNVGIRMCESCSWIASNHASD